MRAPRLVRENLERVIAEMDAEIAALEATILRKERWESRETVRQDALVEAGTYEATLAAQKGGEVVRTGVVVVLPSGRATGTIAANSHARRCPHERCEGKEHKLWMMHWLVEAEADASRPVLLHFPSGMPPPSALNNPPKEGGLKLKLTKSTSKSEKRKAWRAGITACSKAPNVWCKISGLMGAQGGTDGPDADVAKCVGYLVRTKPEGEADGGVCKGVAVLDSLVLADC